MKAAGTPLFAAAALLLSCTASNQRVIYHKGKKLATVEMSDDIIHGEVEGYDSAGRVVYRSRFIGGCMGQPAVGQEEIGTKFEYDANGNFISRWEISPDSQRAVYYKKTRKQDACRLRGTTRIHESED